MIPAVPRMLSLVIATMAMLCLFAGSAQAKIIVPVRSIEQKVTQYILESTTLTDPKAKLIIECQNLPTAPVELPGDELNVSMEDHRATPIPYNTIVHMTFSTEQGSTRIGIAVKVWVERPVWVTTKLIPSKTPLTMADVRLETKRLSQTEAMTLGQQEAVTAYTSKMNVPAGTVLDLNHVRKIPLVTRQHEIRIILSMGNGVQVTAMGEAIEDGAQGQQIKVMQKREGQKAKIYTGQVMGKNVVLVKL